MSDEMQGPNPLDGLNPVLVTAIEAFTRSTADAFVRSGAARGEKSR